MNGRTRREFLADVGRGMLIAGVGSGVAADLGLATSRAAEGSDRLTFGAREPLVGMLQDTPPDKMLPLLVRMLHDGAELKDLVAAAALANARSFGGQDYTGYHTLMALAPAFHMSNELPADRAPLAVFKVLYRNSARIQEKGGAKNEVLHPVRTSGVTPTETSVRDVVRTKDMDAAERAFAGLAGRPAAEAFDQLLTAVEDGHDVHRVVLPYRAWCLLDFVGHENAMALLRQSLRYCVESEQHKAAEYNARIRELLPKLIDQYHLDARKSGHRKVDDAWVDKMSTTIFQSKAEEAAEAAAAALAEGIDPDAVGEAITLAANQLVLRDSGRRQNEVRPGKPLGSVHGDSIGVHASDSANAWRHMARVAGPRNAACCLIMGAYQASIDRVERGGDFLNWHPRPWAEHKQSVTAHDPATLLQEAEAAIRANDQARACAVVARCGELGHPARPVFDLLLKYAVSEEGALHAEKYYRTVAEEFAETRPAFRWRHLIALARVTASECGQPAPGYADACRMLGV
jgi:hypothetical protein